MRRAQLSLVISGLRTGILDAALFFQMLPLFLLLVVMAHALGVSGREMLVIVPAALFAMAFVACWLASKRPSIRHGRVPAWPPPRLRRTDDRPVRGPVPLMKTKAERYQDLKDVLVRNWIVRSPPPSS